MTDVSEEAVSILPTYQVTIYIAGDVATAERVIREHCYQNGCCVTITQTKFIYTGGEETGVAVGLVNYPRFTSTPEQIDALAEILARSLIPACNQTSCLLVSTTKTRWISITPPGVPV